MRSRLGLSKGINTSPPGRAGSASASLGQTIIHTYLASIGYGVLGTALAIILRSPAVAVGVAYALRGETSINRLWNSADRRLPGELLSALTHGGTNTTSYSHALVTLTIYTAIVGAGTLALFQRRDVWKPALPDPPRRRPSRSQPEDGGFPPPRQAQAHDRCPGQARGHFRIHATAVV